MFHICDNNLDNEGKKGINDFYSPWTKITLKEKLTNKTNSEDVS